MLTWCRNAISRSPKRSRGCRTAGPTSAPLRVRSREAARSKRPEHGTLATVMRFLLNTVLRRDRYQKPGVCVPTRTFDLGSLCLGPCSVQQNDKFPKKVATTLVARNLASRKLRPVSCHQLALPRFYKRLRYFISACLVRHAILIEANSAIACPPDVITLKRILILSYSTCSGLGCTSARYR